MVREHERIVLRAEVADQGLEEGDVGTVVHIHRGGRAVEAEFVSLDGKSMAVVTLPASKIRPVRHSEIPHARRMVFA